MGDFWMRFYPLKNLFNNFTINLRYKQFSI